MQIYARNVKFNNFLALNSLMKTKLGDLIFWSRADFDAVPKNVAGKFEDAIVASGAALETKDPSEKPFHVSLVVNDESDLMVHATHKGVCTERISEYAKALLAERDHVKIIEAKLDIDRSLKMKAVKTALSKIGHPYNDIFSSNCRDSLNREAYYCCQLIRAVFDQSKSGIQFPVQPLNFRDETGRLIEFWVQYFKDKGFEIPEDDFGSHPSSLLTIKELQILSTFVLNEENFDDFFGTSYDEENCKEDKES